MPNRLGRALEGRPGAEGAPSTRLSQTAGLRGYCWGLLRGYCWGLLRGFFLGFSAGVSVAGGGTTGWAGG
jgi:hypothetical protein